MKKNCNLELRLLPSSESFNPLPDYDTQYHNSMLEMLNENSSSTIMQQEEHHRHQHVTISLKDSCLNRVRRGQMQQEEEHKKMSIFYKGQIAVSDVTELQARTIIKLASSPTKPLPMKRSLQRFLQKRKHRAQAASTYLHQLAN